MMINKKIKIISIETVIGLFKDYYMLEVVIENKGSISVEILSILYNTSPDTTRMVIEAKGFYWLYKSLKDARDAEDTDYLEKFLAPLPEEERISTKLLFEIGEI